MMKCQTIFVLVPLSVRPLFCTKRQQQIGPYSNSTSHDKHRMQNATSSIF